MSSLACQTITPADMVGITMLVEGKPRTAIFTDEASVEIDAAHRTGAGPCMDAFRHQQVVSLPSVAEDRRWPEFSRSAGEHGIGSVLSMPLVVNHEAFQVLVRASQRENRKLRDIAGALVNNAQSRKTGT